MTRAGDPETWSGVDRIPDAELWEARRRQRSTLVDEVRSRSTTERLLRGDVPEYVRAAADTFDPDVLPLGFARRVAGKAHPRDEEAKRVLQRLFGMKGARIVGQRVVFLDDYDLATAAWLVRGWDVWLNVPRPPLG